MRFIILFILFCVPYVSIAQHGNSEKQNANYILKRGHIVLAGGQTKNSDLTLINQLGLQHFGSMQGYMFNIGPSTKVIQLSREEKIPVKYALYQNFPNPFNASTIIRYSLPRESDVEIIVYSILGRQVITLVSGFQPAGLYEISYRGVDAQNNPLPSGLYMCRMKTKDFDKTIKIAILR